MLILFGRFKALKRDDLIIHLVIIVLLIVNNALSMEHLLDKSYYFYFVNLFFTCSITIVITYIHAYYLFPKYLNKGEYLKYFLTLVLSVLFYLFVTLGLDYIEMDFLMLTEERFDVNWRLLLFRVVLIGRFFVFAYLLYALNEKLKQSREIGQMKAERLQAEISQMKAQINPHFLFNTLNNIYGLALEKSERTPELILRLSKMMDYMLYDSSELLVSLRKDIQNIVDYVEIEKIRNGNLAKIDLELMGDIDNQRIAPLMLLPIVENAFKHGLNGMIDGAYVRIRLLVNDERVELNVQNNYYRSNDNIDSNHGIGLANLKRRLELFYPGQHELIIDDTNSKFSVTMCLTLKKLK